MQTNNEKVDIGHCASALLGLKRGNISALQLESAVSIVTEELLTTNCNRMLSVTDRIHRGCMGDDREIRVASKLASLGLFYIQRRLAGDRENAVLAGFAKACKRDGVTLEQGLMMCADERLQD